MGYNINGNLIRIVHFQNNQKQGEDIELNAEEKRVYTLPSDELSDKGLVTSVDTLDPYGDHVRPHIVFFGEAVPNMEAAAQLAHDADIFVVIGTSLVVYPAAALIQYVKRGAPIYYIDPKPAAVPDWVHVIQKPATQGVADLIDILRKG